MRHVAGTATLLVLGPLILAGCTQNPYSGGQPTFPWQQQAPLGAKQGPFGSLYADLQRRASDQQRLLQEQQRQLAQLADLQRQNDQKTLAARQQQQQTQWRQAQTNRDATSQQQQQALGQFNELQQRASSLDTNNRDLHSQLRRSQQQLQLLQDQVKLLQQRLGDTAEQLTQAQRQRQWSDQQMKTLQASTRKRAGASITANNSLKQRLTAVNIPGIEVRQDGDLVRIELPADRLFLEKTATLHQGASPYVDQVAEVIRRNYPRQMIGIEAHSDDASVTSTLWRNQHQLTAAQAMAIFEQLTQRHQLSPQQLFVLGHGHNHPVAPNTTPAGQARNRRIEVVIYPETLAQR